MKKITLPFFHMTVAAALLCAVLIRHGWRCLSALARVFAKQKVQHIITAWMLLLCAACGGSPAPISAPVASAQPAPAPDELDAAVRETSDYLNKQLPKGNKLLILNVQSDFPALSEYIIDELIANTVNDRVFSVVDRQQLNTIRAELDFQMSGAVDDASAQALGRMTGAQIIISGAVSRIGDLYRLRIRALSVQSAQIEGQFNRNIPDGPTVTALVKSKATGYGSGTATASATGNRTPASSSAPAVTPVPVPAQAPAPAPVPAVPTTYKIGDTGPAGGFIFYDKGNNSGGWRYLEAAPASTERTLPFFVEGYGMYNSVKCGDKRVGAGKENTRIWMQIISKEGGGINTAQWYCDQLTANGYDDWYLPTEDELLYMYNSFSNGLGDFQGKEYWASNDFKDIYYNQIFVDFSNGKVGTNFFNKEAKHLVRAIRQF
jgi:hypothetical protein